MSTKNNPVGENEKELAKPAWRDGEWRVIWVLWLTYGAFYFCRTNISSAVPGLKTSVEEGGLGLTASQVGLILGAAKVSYGIGQFFNGLLAERFSARWLLAAGMLGSAALNVLFGFSTAFYFLLFVWACNHYCQSLGWTPCMRVVANWVPVSRRGKSIGVIGTGYQITLGLTFVVASWSAQWFGWRGAMFVPATMLTAAAVVMLMFLQDAPGDENRDSQPQLPRDTPRKPIQEGDRTDIAPGTGAVSWIMTWARDPNLWVTLSNPSLWLLGISLGLLNACRYGYVDWGISHLMDAQKTGVGEAGMKYGVLAAGAALGSYVAGWATDRFFGSRRGPVICGLLLALSGLGLIYDDVAHTSGPGTIVLLLLIGFCIFGPQVLLVGTAPADLARGGTSAAAAGFVNFMGYMGAATGDIVTGYCLKKYDWHFTLYVWAAWAFGASIAAGLLWNAKANPKDELKQPARAAS